MIGAVKPSRPSSSCGQGSEGAAHRSLLDHLLVVSPAHVRIHDFVWQAALYRLFHQRTPSRLSHGLCVLPNVLTWFLFAAQVPLAHALDLGLLLAAGLAGLYFFYDRLVGLVLLPALAALYAGASLLVAHWGTAAPARTALLAAGLSFVQALGHAAEPVPPPWSGANQFVPLRAWLRRAPAWRIATFSGMAFIGSLLEYWASPRLLPVQAMMILNLLGYKPAFRARTARMTAAYAADIRAAFRGERDAEGV